MASNERVRLLTTALNNGAVAAVAAAVVGPTATELYGITIPTTPYWSAFGTCWMILVVGLHMAARRFMGDVEP